MNGKHTSSDRLRQLVDWSSAVWAGLIGGIAFFLMCFFAVPLAAGGNGWVMVRLLASVPMGAGVLAPPATYDPAILIAALSVHLVLSIGFAMLAAFVLHRGGLWTGILGGASLGLALYAINFYTLTLFFPWFFGYRSFALVLTHMIFGAICGGVYEGLEVEEFEPADFEDGP